MSIIPINCNIYILFIEKAITRKVIMCTRDSKFWKHSRGRSPLGPDGLIRTLIVTKLKLFLEDIRSHILGMFVNLSALLWPHI